MQDPYWEEYAYKGRSYMTCSGFLDIYENVNGNRIEVKSSMHHEDYDIEKARETSVYFIKSKEEP